MKQNLEADWLDPATHAPPLGEDVFVWGMNERGGAMRCIAFHARPGQVEVELDSDVFCDVEGDAGVYYLREGWYQRTTTGTHRVEFQVQAWCPMPSTPPKIEEVLRIGKGEALPDGRLPIQMKMWYRGLPEYWGTIEHGGQHRMEQIYQALLNGDDTLLGDMGWLSSDSWSRWMNFFQNRKIEIQ
jgi:hypothetical protein